MLNALLGGNIVVFTYNFNDINLERNRILFIIFQYLTIILISMYINIKFIMLK